MADSLQQILGDYYSAKVLGVGSMGAIGVRFQTAAQDSAFVAEARARMSVCKDVQDKCFASKVQLGFLTQQIAAL